MTIAQKIHMAMDQSSWIREMFEEGARLKARFGSENVYDFSIGNPNLPPPSKFNEVLKETVDSCGLGDHCYMPQSGYPQVCRSIADYLSEEQEVAVSENEVAMTCGAAGALNVILKTLLDPGDEVILTVPVFVDYQAYVDNHGGISRLVPCHADFTLDLDAIAKAVTGNTKAMIINSPNNPSGQIYSAASLSALGQVLADKGRELGRTIYLISDEPYRKIVFDGHQVPSIFRAYTETFIATSYSKDLSIPGERIGFAAVNPQARYKNDIILGLKLANRILGFINAPALMQRVISCLQGLSVNIGEYLHKRDLLCGGLLDAGYDFVKPKGSFYLFPRTPISDDVKFVQALQQEKILTVPGAGFKCPGYFRIAFCVSDETIDNAMPGFKRAMAMFR
jgi:aspartate aminotransferase